MTIVQVYNLNSKHGTTLLRLLGDHDAPLSPVFVLSNHITLIAEPLQFWVDGLLQTPGDLMTRKLNNDANLTMGPAATLRRSVS
jgi:hypothetical protein